MFNLKILKKKQTFICKNPIKQKGQWFCILTNLFLILHFLTKYFRIN